MMDLPKSTYNFIPKLCLLQCPHSLTGPHKPSTPFGCTPSSSLTFQRPLELD